MFPATIEQDGSITLRLDSAFYEVEAIQLAAHAFTASFTVALAPGAAGTVHCNLTPKAGIEPGNPVGDFMNELLDQQLRVRLRRETEPIRRLILAQAFSRTDLFTSNPDEGKKD